MYCVKIITCPATLKSSLEMFIRTLALYYILFSVNWITSAFFCYTRKVCCTKIETMWLKDYMNSMVQSILWKSVLYQIYYSTKCCKRAGLITNFHTPVASSVAVTNRKPHERSKKQLGMCLYPTTFVWLS